MKTAVVCAVSNEASCVEVSIDALIRHADNPMPRAPPVRVAVTAAVARLLDWIVVAGVAGVNRLASGKSFVLAVVETDAIFAQLPAEIHFLVVNARGKIQQPHFQVFYHATGFLNLVQR